jgi:hypothetical protein
VSGVPTILRKLEACLVEELGAQRRVLARLEAQQAALRAGDPAALDARGREIEADVDSSLQRAQVRAALLRLLAAEWRVDSRTLTLGSIAERAGGEGQRLQRLRGDLRRASAATARALRRNARAARAHQRAWGEVLEGVLSAAVEGDPGAGGRLVDAEA